MNRLNLRNNRLKAIRLRNCKKKYLAQNSTLQSFIKFPGYTKISSIYPDVLNLHIGVASNNTVTLYSSVGPIQFFDSLT